MKTAQRFHSRVTQKGQATIPVFIRNILHIHPEDVVEFRIDDSQNIVLVKKEEENENIHYSQLASAEWESDADNTAYNDL